MKKSDYPRLQNDMILYTGKPKDSTNRISELMNEFSKVPGYKIYIQKSIAFLYTNKKLLKKQSHS